MRREREGGNEGDVHVNWYPPQDETLDKDCFQRDEVPENERQQIYEGLPSGVTVNLM